MQQVSQNVFILDPGEAWQDTYEKDYLKIFLSGTTTQNPNSWQMKFTNGLQGVIQGMGLMNIKLLVINPALIQPQQDDRPILENPEFGQKINWSLQMRDKSDLIFCNILPNSTNTIHIAPIFESAQTGKLICRMPVEHPMYGYTKLLSDYRKFPLLGGAANLMDVLNTAFNSIPAFSNWAKYNMEEDQQ